MSSPIDLSRLPIPNIIETLDYEQILAERKAALLDLVKPEQRAEVEATLALESEPLTKLLQESALREMTLRNRVNDAARAVMLAFAMGTDQDQIGANFNTGRLLNPPADPTANQPVEAVWESDDAYQLRIQEAFDGLSVAGPRAAYEHFARSAHGQVADARAYSPAPCEVVVSVLSAIGDGTASSELITAVAAALSPEDVRPLGDEVTVRSVEIVEYQIDATIFVGSGPESSIVRSAAAARVEVESRPKRPIGRSVYRAAHIAALKVEGVIDVELRQPAENIPISLTQAARCTGINIAVEVVDE